MEEKYLGRYRVPALLAVGLEGFWGLLISLAALPALGALRGPDGLPIDSLPQALRVRPARRSDEFHALCQFELHGKVKLTSFLGSARSHMQAILVAASVWRPSHRLRSRRHCAAMLGLRLNSGLALSLRTSDPKAKGAA